MRLRRITAIGVTSLLMAAGILWVCSPYILAKSNKLPARRPAPSRSNTQANLLAQSRADLVKASQDYKTSLEKLLSFYESDVRRWAEQVEKRRELYKVGGIAKRTLEESEQTLADAQARVEKVRAQIAEAENLITEAQAAIQFSHSDKAEPGSYYTSTALIRYNGPVQWRLADTFKIKSFYSAQFGRDLPISAYGQTAVHDRMGFDHHNALDIALHPDSSEGRALLAHLRQLGIPFIAFRYEVPGSATGAHIHIGKPSQRFF